MLGPTKHIKNILPTARSLSQKLLAVLLLFTLFFVLPGQRRRKELYQIKTKPNKLLRLILKRPKPVQPRCPSRISRKARSSTKPPMDI